MIIQYTAQRSLIGGHIAGNSYQLVIDTTLARRSRRAEKISQRSLSGSAETLYYYGENSWHVTFQPTNGSDALALREFLDSTESGEIFWMTLNGDDKPVVYVIRSDSGFDWAQFLPAGGPDLDWLQPSIEVIEQ